ncbi:MAG: YkgJ family cysteine cluster protein [Nitrospira sp.]|nr:YkgJ family cysteine cluster protein [Nitrospira sp.]
MNHVTSKEITHCIRCGTCCLKGGPVLHHEDKQILREGHIGYQHLVTIRKGELAHNPMNGKLEPVPQELIKVVGKGEDWSCIFYDEKKASCAIYEHRFLECRLLQCWDTAEIMAVIGKDTIIRADIINPNDPIMHVIETHEQECPYQEVEILISTLSKGEDKGKTLKRLTELVRKDVSIRSFALSELELKKEYELFIFGRPLFKVLKDRGLTVHGKI